MGVSGSGKTTLAKAIAAEYKGVFIEGDDFHPTVNIEKMKSGQPLTDEDRIPWLRLLNEKVREDLGETIVLACSALKQSYRNLIATNIPSNALVWIQLNCDRDTLTDRMKNRSHFMPLSLLQSQLDTLEPCPNALVLNSTENTTQLLQQLKYFIHEQKS
jgi:carbohydrate kinase (thermoresistant glucokinase family)